MEMALLIALGVAALVAALLAVMLVVHDVATRSLGGSPLELPLDPRSLEEERLFSPTIRYTGRIDKAFHALVIQSGTGLDVSGALALIVGVGAIGGTAAFVFSDNLLAAAGGLAAGSILTLLWIVFARWRHLAAMKKVLADSLQMVADNLRAGRTLEQATEMVSRDTTGPLAVEFGHFASQLKLGHSPVAVLQQMIQRIPLPEFRIFATAVAVHRRTGGNLAMLAERMAAAARDRHELSGHLNAVTAGSRLSAIGLIFFAIVGVTAIAYFEPNYVQRFLASPLGMPLLATALTLQFIGIIWVWRLLQVRY